MTDDEIIAVVQAHKEGKKIEWTPVGKSQWVAKYSGEYIELDTYNFNYRVAPEPRRPREWIFARYDNASWLKFDPSIPNPVGYKEIIRVREVIE